MKKDEVGRKLMLVFLHMNIISYVACSPSGIVLLEENGESKKKTHCSNRIICCLHGEGDSDHVVNKKVV